MVYPEGTDAVTPLQEVIKQAIPADDTGWVSLSVQGGFAGSVEVRRVNKTVLITASVQWGTASGGDMLCQLPVEFQPGRLLWFPWVTNSTTLGLQARVTADGGVYVHWASSRPGESTYMRLTQTWFAE